MLVLPKLFLTEFEALVEKLKGEEDFSATVYKDSLGFDTIGFGTNLREGITKVEGELLLRERLSKAQDGIAKAWKPFKNQTLKIRSALADMSYQLGVHGVLEFTHMLDCFGRQGLRDGLRKPAQDSEWYKQTPKRAKRVISVIINHA